MSTLRTGLTLRVGLAAAVAMALAPTLASPASAASYRYWSYWQAGPDGWEFASAGPASTVPADGAVEGWRFAVTSAAGSALDAPRAQADFASVCTGAGAAEGMKRVALVVDPGDAASAPTGQAPPAGLSTCVVIEADATGYDVLRSTVPVRTQDGLICGIDGYPADECAPVVEEPTVASSPSSPSSPAALTPASPQSASPQSASPASDDTAEPGTPWVTVAVIAVIVALGVGLWRWRRA